MFTHCNSSYIEIQIHALKDIALECITIHCNETCISKVIPFPLFNFFFTSILELSMKEVQQVFISVLNQSIEQLQQTFISIIN